MDKLNMPVAGLNTKEVIALVSLAETYLEKFGPKTQAENAEIYAALIGATDKLHRLLFGNRAAKMSA
jgi:ribosome-associated translation inhibitor RaiA